MNDHWQSEMRHHEVQSVCCINVIFTHPCNYSFILCKAAEFDTALDFISLMLFAFLCTRRECPRRGPADLANVIVVNPRPSFRPLGADLPWCEEWTACQVESIEPSCQ